MGELEPGWLSRALEQNRQDVDEWPRWMRREAGLGDTPGKLERLEAELAQAQAELERTRQHFRQRHGIACAFTVETLPLPEDMTDG
jgi:hypothetical protein